MQSANFIEMEDVHTWLNQNLNQNLNMRFEDIMKNYSTIVEQKLLSNEDIDTNVFKLRSKVANIEKQAEEALQAFNSAFASYISQGQQLVNKMERTTTNM
ncbi:MAG: hypothetical protein ACI4VO_05910 [Clostridia bacterium]